MKRGLMIAVAALVFAFASPVWALTQDEAQGMVDATGCVADVEVIQGNSTNGAFLPAGWYGGPWGGQELEKSIILIVDNPAFNPHTVRMILVHEIGHCIDFMDGGIDRSEAPWYEWWADEYGIENAARFGINPSVIVDDFIDYYSDVWKEPASPTHGDRRGRILHVLEQITKRGYGRQGA